MGFSGITASGIERMLACPASVILPKVHRTNEQAARGTEIHRYVNAVLSGTPAETAIASVPEDHRETCSQIDWRGLGGDLRDVRSEVSYALNVRDRTARELGVNIGRDYARFELDEWDVVGTLDIEGTRIDDVPVIDDLKSGWVDVTPLDENGQQRFFGAVKYVMTGSPDVEIRIAKLLEDGTIRPKSHTLTAFDSEEFIDELEKGVSRVHEARRIYLAGGTPNVTMGDHCRYCESMASCPAYSRLALAVVGETTELAKSVATITPVQRGLAWTKARALEDILESVLKALKAAARQEPFPVGEGKVVRAVASGSSSFDVGAATALLRSFGASEAQISGLYRRTSFDVIRETNAPGVKRAKKKAA
jgi:hypothetical protein